MKKLGVISLLIILGNIFKCFGQFNLAWNDAYQHSGSQNFSNESRKIGTDAAGNVFVLADLTSDIDPAGNVTGSTYHYTILLKDDASGSRLDEELINVFAHNISGYDNLGAFGLEVDASGNV